MAIQVGDQWGTETIPAATATKIADALPVAQGWVVQNETGAAIRVGFDNTVSATKGFLVLDGAAFSWGDKAPSDELWVYSAGGGDVTWARTHRAG